MAKGHDMQLLSHTQVNHSSSVEFKTESRGETNESRGEKNSNSHRRGVGLKIKVVWLEKKTSRHTVNHKLLINLTTIM